MQHWAQTILEDAFWLTAPPPEHVRNGLERLARLVEGSTHHVFRSKEIEQLADNLAEVEDMEEFAQLLSQLTVETGFQNYMIFIIREAQGMTSKARILTSLKEQWIKKYQAGGYQFIDPVMLRAHSSDGYFDFSETEASGPLVESFWQDAENHNVGRNGICFATTRQSGLRIGLSLYSVSNKEKIHEIKRLHGYDLYHISEIVFDSFSFLSSGPSIPEGVLNTDEIRFLRNLAISSNPSDLLKANARWGSTETMQKSIRLKLGVQSAYQAVAIAASKGWLNSLPYDKNDIISTPRALNGIQDFEPVEAE